ncbi:META domain-containing protein [Gemmobacter serpentinus]|uniref:META domain-containing protein n=1 Tax=Gemmobacter serpentinus TaxID=2652247 RepID=UPI00124EF583|nr:META domain-containing protein [Gemmobacter serpentinus]
MKRPVLATTTVLAATLSLAACQPTSEATPSSEAVAKEWQLVGFSGDSLPPRVTMDLREAGKASGQAPCNRWFGAVEGSLPDFRIGQAGATRMACPDLEAEGAFLTALGQISTAAIEGDKLILTGSDGVRMEFTAKAP